MPTYTGTSGGDTFTAPTNEGWTIIGKGGPDVLTVTGAGIPRPASTSPLKATTPSPTST